MCAIIGWAGRMPKGLISKMLAKAEDRGRDGIGVAFRNGEVAEAKVGGGKNIAYRIAEPAHTFISDSPEILSDARRSLRGLAHTRRASRGMPINDKNTHPFRYWKSFFAHNGKVNNWQDVRSMLEEYYTKQEAQFLAESRLDAAKTARYCADYCKNVTTDSMVLGPYIESRDFSALIGSIAVVWMRGADVYAYRRAKECVGTTITWKYKTDPELHLLTLIASTPEIIETFNFVPDVEFDLGTIKPLKEAHIYKLLPSGLEDEGEVPANTPVEDMYSSEPVVETVAIEEINEDTNEEPKVTESVIKPSTEIGPDVTATNM